MLINMKIKLSWWFQCVIVIMQCLCCLLHTYQFVQVIKNRHSCPAWGGHSFIDWVWAIVRCPGHNGKPQRHWVTVLLYGVCGIWLGGGKERHWVTVLLYGVCGIWLGGDKERHWVTVLLYGVCGIWLGGGKATNVIMSNR